MFQLKTLLIASLLSAMAGCINMPADVANELNVAEGQQPNNYAIAENKESTGHTDRLEAVP